MAGNVSLEKFDLKALRGLKESELPDLCRRLRERMISVVSKTGGHLASSLGAIELCVALHYVFNTPKDKIVFDVGHQAYAHKMLTGRLERFETLRRFHGVSGFPKRTESSYDAFGTAHSSTSVSAALGMAVADALAGDKTAWHVAVIGDGALTGGMALEALNHAGTYRDGLKLLIILNDNDCSISPSVGAIKQHLATLVSGDTYTNVRRFSKDLLSGVPALKRIVKSVEQRTINFVSPPSTLFSAFDIKYYGPVNGHDVGALVKILANISRTDGPAVLHIHTVKGKGYPKAEADPTLYHGVTPFDPAKGIRRTKHSANFTDVFSAWICEAAARRPEIFAITPAMREGSGLVEFQKRFPERYADVAIAEQHAVTFAAGLAAAGMHPVAALYSTFAQRAYDQILHDVAIQNLPVTFAFDRAGLVGADGETHHGAFDIAFMRSIPNVVIMAPADAASAREMLEMSVELNGPSVVRYPRAQAVESLAPDREKVALGKAFKVRQSARKRKRACVFAFGLMAEVLKDLCEAEDATLYDMRFVKPLDRQAIAEAAASHDYLFTAEDSVAAGGAGSAVLECLSDMGVVKPVTVFGLKDFFAQQGTLEELLRENGLDAASIRARMREVMREGKLDIRENVSLKGFNTMGVDARADCFVEIRSPGELRRAFAAAAARDLPVFVLGGGSNLVLTQDKIRALCLRIAIEDFTREGEDKDHVFVHAGAGLAWHPFVERCLALGLYGAENLALIYGTVGGAVVQNIGAYGTEVSSLVRSVDVYDPEADAFSRIKAADLQFGYRTSLFKQKQGARLIVTGVTFAFGRVFRPNLSYAGLKRLAGESPCAREVFDAVVALRKKKLPDPAVTPSAGSFFKNPVVDKKDVAALREKIPALITYEVGGGRVKLSAGQLLEAAGFKGAREGGVGTSENHALVVCNFENASGAQVARFAEKLSDGVFAAFGVRLEAEPVFYPKKE